MPSQYLSVLVHQQAVMTKQGSPIYTGQAMEGLIYVEHTHICFWWKYSFYNKTSVTTKSNQKIKRGRTEWDYKQKVLIAYLVTSSYIFCFVILSFYSFHKLQISQTKTELVELENELFIRKEAVKTDIRRAVQDLLRKMNEQVRLNVQHHVSLLDLWWCMGSAEAMLTHLPWTKWPPFCRRFFLIHFREWKCIDFNWKFTRIPKGPINNIPALVQIMAWQRSGDSLTPVSLEF